MQLSLTAQSVFSQKLPVAVVGGFENERLAGPPAWQRLFNTLSPKEFHGGDRQIAWLHSGEKSLPSHLLLVGLGQREDCRLETWRAAVGRATKKLQEAGLARAAVQIGDPLPHGGTLDDALYAAVEAAVLANYRFRQFKTDNDQPGEIDSLVLCLPAKANLRAAAVVLNRARVVAEAANYARAIANLPGNVVSPAVLADYARQLAREQHLKCTVLDKPALAKRGFGGLLAVGGGSRSEPRLIVLEYQPRSPTRSAQPVALVGKAITFDSGGISIKPSDKMEEMKFDKCGGVAVLGALRAVAALRLPVPVIGIIAAAENLPSATSYRPGDIVTSYRGVAKRAVTIEVVNTDAEGRIVLGDALAYARERQAQAIIDLATLTGACVVALGQFAAGLLGNDEKLQQKIRAAAERTGERVWPLPLWPEYRDKIKSDVADIKNSSGREAATITAATFLANYVGDTPWAHLDIAGTAWTTEERPCFAKGATGFGIRLLTDVLQNWK